MHPDAIASIFRRNMISLVDERKARDSRRRLRRRPPTPPASPPPLDAA
jgi:hypothetical protein